MTLLIVAIVLALAGAGWVAHPLIARKWGLMTDAVSSSIVIRQTRKRVALAALKEVEYDRVAGKLDDTDYEALKGQLEQEALTALRAADATPSAPSGGPAVRHRCGFRNPGGSRFCAGCGQPLV
jgi:hypothetical protein